MYLSLQLTALVGILHPDASSAHLHYLRAALDIRLSEDSIAGAGERLMLDELESAAVINQCISCYTRGVVISA